MQSLTWEAVLYRLYSTVLNMYSHMCRIAYVQPFVNLSAVMTSKCACLPLQMHCHPVCAMPMRTICVCGCKSPRFEFVQLVCPPVRSNFCLHLELVIALPEASTHVMTSLCCVQAQSSRTLHAKACVAEHSDAILAVHWAGSASQGVSSDRGGTILTWSPTQAQEVHRSARPISHTPSCMCVCEGGGGQ